MLVSDVEIHIPLPQSVVTAKRAFENELLRVNGVDVIRQFAGLRKSRLAVVATLRQSGRRRRRCRRRSLRDEMLEVRIKRDFDDVRRRGVDRVFVAQMEIDVASPNVDKVALVAPEAFLARVEGVFVIF